MIKITILNNKLCKITDADETRLKRLRRVLSYKQSGYEYTAQHRNYNWDGTIYLMTKKNEFALGLLEKVKLFLNTNQQLFTIEDQRIPVPFGKEIDISKRLMELKKVPRDYQIEILNACLANSKGIIRSVTGSGKTNVAAMITAKMNYPTNVYVIGLDLLQQFHALFSEIFDEPIGFIGNGRCEVHRINIISIWTAGRALGIKTAVSTEEDVNDDEEDNTMNYPKIVRCLRAAKLHLFDECHTIVSETIKTIYAAIDPERIYGLSGTPYRDDGTTILSNSILGEQIIDISASRLIKEGYLSQPIIKFVKVPKLHIGGNSTYQTIYKEYITENVVRNNLIVENTKDLLAKGYQTLVLFKHLAHGKNLKELFEEQGINCEYLSGKDTLDIRLNAKNRLLEGKSNLVLASTIMDIGVDIPTLSGLVLAGGSKSNIRVRQRVGRVCRIFPGKKCCAVVDFYDDIKYLKNHSKIRYNIYKSEDGFKIINSSSLTKLLT
jgi:superfamily II DNA or RNA helicase